MLIIRSRQASTKTVVSNRMKRQPKGVAAFMSQFVGTKEGASADACRAIDRWLERQRARG